MPISSLLTEGFYEIETFLTEGLGPGPVSPPIVTGGLAVGGRRVLQLLLMAAELKRSEEARREWAVRTLKIERQRELAWKLVQEEINRVRQHSINAILLSEL